jgi:hypothetical protein
LRSFSFPDNGEALLTITIPIIANWWTGGDSNIPNAKPIERTGRGPNSASQEFGLFSGEKGE